MSASEFIYYTLLKHGKIIIAIVGFMIAIIVFMYTQNFGMKVDETTQYSLVQCDYDSDCFEHCGECVSIKDSRFCEDNESIHCACINNTCSVS